MTLRLIFWVVMLIALIMGVFWWYPVGLSVVPMTGLVNWILFFIVGWQVFGPPIQRG